MDFNNICMGCMRDKGNADICPFCGFREGTSPDSPQHLPPRTILRGRYLLGKVLGYGGFGVTYLAYDMHLHIKLAIKEYLPREYATRAPDRSTVSAYSNEYNKDFEYGMDKFLEEARMLAQFDEYPNIVSVKDFFKENGTAYFVMSYIEGMTLKEYFESRGGRIPFDEALKLMIPVMNALTEIHSKGLLHRDISPDNIYITSKGQIKLLDFGAARYALGEHSKSMSVILKPGYAPEEQYRAKGKQGPWTDVYALAATFYRAITGEVPPEALDRIAGEALIPPSQLGIEISSKSESAIVKALSLRSDDRFQSIREFQQVLLDVNSQQGIKGPDAQNRNEQLYENIVEKAESICSKQIQTGDKKDSPYKGEDEESVRRQQYKPGIDIEGQTDIREPMKLERKNPMFKFAVPAVLVIALLSGGIYFAKGSGTTKGTDTTKGIISVAATSNNGKSDNKNMDKEQYIKVGLRGKDYDPYDPSKAINSNVLYVLQETMEGLAREEVINGENRVVPAGAEKWEVSSDNLTWTFYIRNNKWSDGREVTAKDYEYGMKRTLDKKTDSEFAYLLIDAGVKGAADFNSGKITADQVGIRAKDNKTLQIVLNKPCPYFEKLLTVKALLPQRQDVVESLGSKYGALSDTASCNSMPCNGPFKLAHYKEGEGIELYKNDQYWDKDNVKIVQVSMKFIPDESKAVNSIEKNEIDLAQFTYEEFIKKLNESGKFNVIKNDVPYTQSLVFNTKDRYFYNAKIRRAFTLAINREDLVKSIGSSINRPAYAWIPNSIQLGNIEYRKKVPEFLKNISEDPRKLLMEGLKEAGLNPDPSKMVVNITVLINSFQPPAGDYLKNIYKTMFGIDVKVEYVDWTKRLTKITAGDFHIVISSWKMDVNDPADMSIWRTGSTFQPSGWSNKRYDQLVQEAGAATDYSKRLQCYSEAEKILVLDDCPVMPLYSWTKNFHHQKYVKNAMLPLFAEGPELKYAYTEGRGK